MIIEAKVKKWKAYRRPDGEIWSTEDLETRIFTFIHVANDIYNFNVHGIHYPSPAFRCGELLDVTENTLIPFHIRDLILNDNGYEEKLEQPKYNNFLEKLAGVE